jgi:polyhydroxybutyrate depolymerase
MLAGLRLLFLLPAILGLAFAARAAPAPGDACLAEGDCAVSGGRYRILLPEPPKSGRRYGAIMFFHGYQGSAQAVASDPGLAAVARRLGVALIAPDGLGASWSFPGSPARNRDEFVFVGAILDDVAQRFPIDPARIMASGFSQGGSMVWYLACRMPMRFAAFTPIAGAFWEPLPERCDGPRPPLIHVHGTSDTTVPLAGRSLRGGIRQGDVLKSFAILAPGLSISSLARMVIDGAEGLALSCRIADVGADTARLELCLHSGGHFFDPAWVERAWRIAMPADGTATTPPTAHVSVKP